MLHMDLSSVAAYGAYHPDTLISQRWYYDLRGLLVE